MLSFDAAPGRVVSAADQRAWRVMPGGPLRGEVRVPGDKSVSHRAVMLGALAEGTTHIHGFLEGEDTRATARAFERMGVRIAAQGDAERVVQGGQALRGIDYALPVASAQVKSALLLAGLYADGTTTVREPHPTRDYTERMLSAFGWPVAFAPGHASLEGGHTLRATEVHVPADFSSAAFFIVAATVVPGSELRLPAVGMNSRRIGLLHVLRAMGADITEHDPRTSGGEPVADLLVRYAPLRGIEVPEAWVPDMIDEFPALFVAAATARGRTVVRGASELRVKESDRIAAMAQGLRALGVSVDEAPDGAAIEGGRIQGGRIDSRGDHRIAMSFAVAAQLADGEVEIDDVVNVATSFPGFVDLASGAGFGLREVSPAA